MATGSAENPNDPRFKFHMEEYKALRTEILEDIKEINNFLIYAALGSSAVFVWLSTAGKGKIDPLLYIGAWWMPLIVCLSCVLRAARVANQIKILAEYIMSIEEKFAYEDIKGWESFLRQRKLALGVNMSYKSRKIVSAVLLIINILVAIAGSYSAATGRSLSKVITCLFCT